MAGTRLLVQIVFTIEFFLVIGWALYKGILTNPRDLLTVAIFQQDGRNLLSRLNKVSPVLNGDADVLEKELPVALLLSQENQVMFWKNVVENKSTNRIAVRGDGSTGLVSKYCHDPALLQEHDSFSNNLDADIIVCESDTSRDRPRIVVVNGTLLFYPRSTETRKKDVEKLIPQQSAVLDCLHPNARINIVLAVDIHRTGRNWKEWLGSLQNAFSPHPWQALVRSRQNPINFSVKTVDGSRSIKSIQNETVQHLDVSLVNDIFGVPVSGQQLEIIYYLPPHDSIDTRVDETATKCSTFINTMISQGNRLIHIVSLSDGENDCSATMDDRAKEAMQATTDWITRQCMGLPISDAMDEDSLDQTFPKWYSKLWWQRTLSHQYDRAVLMAKRQAKLWMDMSYRSPLTKDVVTTFDERVLSPIEKIPALLANHSMEAALDLLEEAIDQLTVWDRDDTYMPPLDFPPEQYAAIFAPLAVPLMLPLLVGLIREYRRYRKLKQKTAGKTEKLD